MFPKRYEGSEYTAILFVIDIFSHKAFGVNLKSKQITEVRQAFEKIWKEAGRYPSILETDRFLSKITLLKPYFWYCTTIAFRGLEFTGNEDYFISKGIYFKTMTGQNKQVSVSSLHIKSGTPKRQIYFQGFCC